MSISQRLRLLLLIMIFFHAAAPNATAAEDGSQHTPFTQITPDNVSDLDLAFTFRARDSNEEFRRKGYSFQATPVYWQGKLFISTSDNQVMAVDATNGDEIWRFDAKLDRDLNYSESASRGVALWHGDDKQCPDRVFIGTHMGALHALNAKTGEPCSNFSNAGTLDLSRGINNFRPGHYGVTSPVAVMSDRIIVGSAVGDNGAVELEQGIVRALDPITGELLWSWDPIPRSSADPAFKTWASNSATITGAANAWAPISVDEERQLVFVPTSSPSPDFYGGERHGSNNYANSIVALDAGTGKVVWHNQLVHHDIWDYDTPAEPSLMTIKRDGKQIPAMVVVTKTGMLYAFNRETGESIYDIEERAVPSSDVPGEETHPTQPFSSIIVGNHKALGPDDAFGIVIFDKMGCQEILRTYRSEGIFTPPSIVGTIQFPGWPGGVNWGGVSLDEERQIAVLNLMDAPGLVKLLPREAFNRAVKNHEMPDWQLTSMSGTPYGMARRVFLSSLGLPCTQPPWGKISAVDLVAGKVLWSKPFGTIEDLVPAIVPNLEFGMPNLGGPLTTASGLIFIGASMDFYFRAYRTDTGEEIWKHRLPTSANAIPMSYMVDGTQYIAIAVGGHFGFETPPGDHLMVFRLREE